MLPGYAVVSFAQGFQPVGPVGELLSAQRFDVPDIVRWQREREEAADVKRRIKVVV